MSSIYHPLTKGAIRLLTLHPRQPDGKIRCSFGVYDIQDESSMPSYIALSYVWGAELPTFEIIVNDKITTIRENLYIFLLHCTHDSLLWIDALCIDQQDNRERSQQVQFMGNIYKRSQMVWTWLGPARDLKLRDSLIDLRDNSSEYFDRVEGYRRSKRGPYVFDELDTLSQCDYWSRAWVVQEFLLAKQTLLIYGDVHIDSKLITSLIDYQEKASKILARKRRQEAEHREGEGYLFYADSDDGTDLFGPILANHNTLMHSMCTQRDNYLPEAETSEEPAIIWLLRNNYKRLCREPRDIIYCLLSLAYPDQDGQIYGINVDYDEDIASVFCSVMNGITLADDAIFAYATMLRRILKIDTELPTQIRSIENQEESYINVRGFIDGEVVEVLPFDDQIIRDEHDYKNLDPSVVTGLKGYESPFSSKRKDLFEWEEEWLPNQEYQNGHYVEKSIQQKVTSISPVDTDENTENMTFLDQLSILDRLQLEKLDGILGLVEVLNLRCFPPNQQNPYSLNAAGVVPSRTALVVMQFATKVSSRREEGNIEVSHFKADYVLGLSRGDVSDRHLTGVMAYDCDNKHFGGSRPIGDSDEFPSYEEMTSVYRPDYLYGKIRLKMKAEEILRLTAK
ncbi:heterokaryon incompatibility protein-domain-containing protein [Annulohypoxylon moriforme]|nr:heterokaryon incompatibility protein-domain-containing protein [Annulohypoxylon moriforme]